MKIPKHFPQIFVYALTIGLIHSGSTSNDNRHGKVFGRGETITKLFVENLIVTSVVPHSCVVVNTDLVPCRNYRYFWNYGPTPAEADNLIMPTQSVSLESKTIEEPDLNEVVHVATPQLPYDIQRVPENDFQGLHPVQTPPPGWGDYLNFFATTVTKVATRLLTETVVDSARTVTFSIKHCKPSKMPFDLPECPSIVDKNFETKDTIKAIADGLQNPQNLLIEPTQVVPIQITRAPQLSFPIETMPTMGIAADTNQENISNRESVEELKQNSTSPSEKSRNMSVVQENAVLNDLLMNIHRQNQEELKRFDNQGRGHMPKETLTNDHDKHRQYYG